ncbi:hypothetical protein [Burkholderia sp. BCC1630]|uniref:hypothetical protein n=1 Tax=Burkholderia sp. BCC1630 TaxID=2676304 RepID=UPI00158ACC14|nr:hypothetical protein [Burkholderia sp. BCC1630]
MIARLSFQSARSLQVAQFPVGVNTLQAVQLERAIHVVGVFSIFEARLQDGLAVADGFKEAKAIISQAGMTDLNERFEDLYFAINVLKHGRGKSYSPSARKLASFRFV